MFYHSRDSAPGQRECDEAIENINRTINKLDQASLAAIGQNLEQNPEGTLKEFQDRMLQSVAQIRDAIDPLASAAKDTPESIGHRVSIDGVSFSSKSVSHNHAWVSANLLA